MQIQAILANSLMDETYKQTLRKIFRIMDTSGDGKIDKSELKEGFDIIIEKDFINDEQAQEIINNLDVDWNQNNDKPEMEFSEFLYGCVDTSADSFLRYCEEAYLKFFDNGQETVDVNELTGILCQERLLGTKSIDLMIEKMDFTKNGSIQYFEFYDVLIEALQPKYQNGNPVTLKKIE